MDYGQQTFGNFRRGGEIARPPPCRAQRKEHRPKSAAQRAQCRERSADSLAWRAQSRERSVGSTSRERGPRAQLPSLRFAPAQRSLRCALCAAFSPLHSLRCALSAALSARHLCAAPSVLYFLCYTLYVALSMLNSLRCALRAALSALRFSRFDPCPSFFALR